MQLLAPARVAAGKPSTDISPATAMSTACTSEIAVRIFSVCVRPTVSQAETQGSLACSTSRVWQAMGLWRLRSCPAMPPEGFSRSSDAISREELRSISERIYRADTNKARKEDIVLNSQNCISPSETGDRVDRCPEP